MHSRLRLTHCSIVAESCKRLKRADDLHGVVTAAPLRDLQGIVRYASAGVALSSSRSSCSVYDLR